MADLTVSPIVDAFMQSISAFNCNAPVVVNAASGFAGNLLDLQVNGVTAFKVPAAGAVAALNGFWAGWVGTNQRTIDIAAYAPKLSFAAHIPIVWESSAFITASIDLSLSRLGPANLCQGKPASATPLPQTFTIGEASRPGTDVNVAGASGTIQSGLGTGTGAVSLLIFQTSELVGAGSGVQTYATKMTLSQYMAGFDVQVRSPMFSFSSGTNITSPVDGVIKFSDLVSSNFNRLQLGGVTASFPAIKRNAAGIDFRLADDSQYSAIKAMNLGVYSGVGMEWFNLGVVIQAGSGTPEGLYSAGVGSIYLRVDGGASTTLYVKQSGTGNTGWVAK